MRSFILLLCLLVSGCSIKKIAIQSMADALGSGSSTVYASDNDPELVENALPFALKTMESLLVQVPSHRGLLISAASGFTQYAYAFVWLKAEEIQPTDSEQAKQLRLRARNLYIRARDYGIRALELKQKNFLARLQENPQEALRPFKKEDVPVLYWTGVSWGAAITQAKGEMDLVADLSLVEAILRRALELDESYDQGSIHEFFLVYEANRAGGSLEKAREHYQRAMQLNGGQRVGPHVSLAENVSVQQQNRKEFLELLDKALRFPVDSAPNNRLANLLAQKRARQLKRQVDDLFLEGEE